MYLFFPIRATIFKRDILKLLLKLCFHELLFLFLIIFTFCICLLGGLGLKVLCSLHALHKLCSNNAFCIHFAIFISKPSLSDVSSAPPAFLFAPWSKPIFESQTHGQSKSIIVALRPDALGLQPSSYKFPSGRMPIGILRSIP